MIVINQVKTDIDWNKRIESTKDMLTPMSVLQKKVISVLHIDERDIERIIILKHSLDARKKPMIYQVYSLGVILTKSVSEDKIVKKCKNPNVVLKEDVAYTLPAFGDNKLMHRPVIVGMGPAGLFCGYMLSLCGYQPILLERGADVDTRTTDVESFWSSGQLKNNSNVQFGEGGAGTFSDGKLNTLIKDRKGRNRKVLEIFVDEGAPEEILYDHKPHIGTDVLKNVVKNMRKTIIEHGGEVYFHSQVTNIISQNGMVTAVEINHDNLIETNHVILAIGHSARDTFRVLENMQIPMEAKAFAVGMRVEHPQEMINTAMYGVEHANHLPAAPYKMTAKTSVSRGVYSFCMCPGGYVVNASSKEERLAVNGMSYSKRDSKNANSAIIVTVTPDDFLDKGPLGGVAFQEELERKAFALGNGKVPVQYYKDFVNNVSSVEQDNFNKPCIKGQYIYANLRGILPNECETAFIEGMEHFDHIVSGFAADDAILSAVESRTSSPVRIHRDESLQSPALTGLYPCGEGAGYAGGITSAAMDGLLVAETIMEKYSPFA